MIVSGRQLTDATENLLRKTFAGGIADLTPMPRVLIDSGPSRSVYRLTAGAREVDGPPVLLVPPLAAPALCFDLRRGCSVAEHLVAGGRRTYLVDYGTISFSDRRLGIEHWVHEVVPKAIEAVSADVGGPVHVVSWCLGGIFSLLADAARPALPVASITAVASPFDVTAIPFLAPARPLVDLTRGHLVTPFYRFLGSAPRRAVRAAFQISALDKYVTKPWAMLKHLDDREFLAQVEAVERFTANMSAYPGRTFGQMYHHFLRSNDLYDGTMTLAGRRISLADVAVPVLAIAGAGDTLAPKRAVRRLPELLTGTEDVTFRVCPGGHLGVLTGRGAREDTWREIDAFVDRVHNPNS